MTTVEEQAVEKNGLRRAVTVGLMGFILCLGLSFEVPELTKKWTDNMYDEAWEVYEQARKEYREAHPTIDYVGWLKDDMSQDDPSNMSEEEVSRMRWEAFYEISDEVMPNWREKRILVEFGLLAGAGLLAALFGLAASAVWTAIQSRRLVGDRVGLLFRAVLPHADFNQTLLFSSRNFKELLGWTAVWLAAPPVLVVGESYVAYTYFGGLCPLAVSLSSFYIFSFWLTLAVYARRGRLADPGARSVKFRSRALLCWFFFIYEPLMNASLAFFVVLFIFFYWLRSISGPPARDARA